MENFGNDELKTLKCVNFRLLTNLNSGFFEWVLDSFYFEQHAVGSKEMSSTIRFLIKNNSKSSFFFFFCIKDSFSLGKLNINYQWIVYDFFLSKWLQKFDNSHQFPHFQFESSIEKKHYVILQKKCQFDMTVSDLDCLENFVEKLCYIINLFYSLMRRTTGYSWVLIEKLDNYSPKNIILVKSLKQHLNDKSNFRKEIAIFASNPIINKPKLNKISHQRQRQGSLNSIFTSQENSDREHITQNELLLLAPSTLISKLTTKNEIFMNNEKEGSTHLNDSQNLNNGIIEQKKIEEAILKKPPLQKIYTEDQNLEKIKKKKIFSTTSNKLDYESSKLSLSQINKKENFESNRLNRAITSNAISTNGLFRKINSELKKKSLNSLNKSNLELSKLEIENYDVRKILRWEDLHLKGLKECSIFPNEKPKIQHFPDVYFYMFSNKYCIFLH